MAQKRKIGALSIVKGVNQLKNIEKENYNEKSHFLSTLHRFTLGSCNGVLDRMTSRTSNNRRILYRLMLSMGFMLVFVLLKEISVRYLSELYWFQWTSTHHYCYIWIVVLVSTFAGEIAFSATITAGNVIGVVLGQFLGDYIRMVRLEKGVPVDYVGTYGEALARLHHHPGFEIWLITLLLLVAFEVLIVVAYKKHR